MTQVLYSDALMQEGIVQLSARSLVASWQKAKDTAKGIMAVGTASDQGGMQMHCTRQAG